MHLRLMFRSTYRERVERELTALDHRLATVEGRLDRELTALDHRLATVEGRLNAAEARLAATENAEFALMELRRQARNAVRSLERAAANAQDAPGCTNDTPPPTHDTLRSPRSDSGREGPSMMYQRPYPVMMGDPGILSLAGRAIGALARSPVGRIVGSVLPGGAAVMGIAGGLATARAMRQAPPGLVPVPGVTGTVQRILPGGETGYMRKRGRRINAGNARAARRAIRRIKAVRGLLKSIERELPRRPAAPGSRGVITRAEASRALRR